MRAMILAAGRGERMRPLTNETPKPLLQVNNKPLIQYHIEHLVHAGIKEIVINHGAMGEKIEACLGNGQQFNAVIHYSAEQDELLDTGGGIYKALTQLGDDPFLVVNADVWTDFPFDRLINKDYPGLAHLVLVDNPVQHPEGDFALVGEQVLLTGEEKYTFSGIGVYHPELFAVRHGGSFPLAPLLREMMRTSQVTGEYYQGIWFDIGTAERLNQLKQKLQK